MSRDRQDVDNNSLENHAPFLSCCCYRCCYSFSHVVTYLKGLIDNLSGIISRLYYDGMYRYFVVVVAAAAAVVVVVVV